MNFDMRGGGGVGDGGGRDPIKNLCKLKIGRRAKYLGRCFFGKAHLGHLPPL